MGDNIELKAVEVIQDGLLQMDFWNHTRHEGFRAFVDPGKFFSMLGLSMQIGHDAFLQSVEQREREESRAAAVYPAPGSTPEG